MVRRMPMPVKFMFAGLFCVLVSGFGPMPAVAQQASCTYQGRVVPHGTQIGVLRCQNGRWVRASG
jgi:hypothetical protein